MTVQPPENAAISGRVAVDALVGEVGLWPGVEVGTHRFGGTVFRLRRREIGHVHEEARGECLVDLPLPRAIRDELVAAGRARPHHVVPDSGWVTVPITSVADLRGTLEIFRLSYDRARR